MPKGKNFLLEDSDASGTGLPDSPFALQAMYELPNGTYAPIVQVNNGGGGGGGGGSSDTTEATQLLVLGELQNLDTDVGATTDAAAPADGTGNYAIIPALKRSLMNSSSLLGRIPNLYSGKIPVNSSNITTKFREAFEADPNTSGKWSVTTASGDIITVDGNAIASSYAVISLNPLTQGTQSVLESVDSFGMPLELSAGISMSQRTLGQEFSFEVISSDTPLTPPTELAISSISQATTTLTVVTATPHNLRPGMRIGTRGVPDSRLNYPALVVATTPNPTTITVTAGPGGAIPSVTAGPFTTGFLFFRSSLGFAPNGTSMIFENATATNASFYIRSESGDVLPSGTVNGNHAVTIATTASIQAINAANTYAFQPTTEYRLALQADRLQWSDAGVDATTATTSRVNRTQVIPDSSHSYKVRIRATNNASLTVPVAKIVSAVKTGTTTATITTDVPHGLTVTDLVNIYGIRDQAAASFPNLTTSTAVSSIVSPTVFTIVIGTASSVTSYGGYVSRINGQNLPSTLGAITQVVQSVTRTANITTVVGSAAWSGLLIGDYVNLHGVRDNTTGADVGVDGAYRVRDIATTNLFLEPINDTVSPNGANIGLTNCGGGVIKRTDMRISFVRVFDYERERVEFLPRPTSDLASAIPVAINNSPAVTVSSGTVTTVSALTGGGAAEDAAAGTNPVVTGGVARTAAAPATLVAGDAVRHTMTVAGAQTMATGAPVASAEVASAARTTSGNSGTISVPTGGSISGLLVVSAQSGTAPTLDVTLEESYDNGVTWSQIWQAPRFAAATGNAIIPPITVLGLRRWAWTIGGATPSFTFAINTNQLSVVAPITRQLYDRTAALIAGTPVNTASASLPITGCKQVTAKISLGAATGPATYQIQVSDDNAAWSNVGTATAGVANAVTTLFMPVGITANFARVIVTAAATSQTGNYIAINASS